MARIIPGVIPSESVAGTGLLGKIFLELAFHAFEFLRVGRLVLLLGDVGPALGVFGVDLEPLLQARLGVRLDGVGGAFGFADAAVDALVGMNDQHVLALVEAVDGADLNAVGIFAFDAGFSDDVSHPGLRKNWLRNDPFSGVCVAHELRSRKEKSKRRARQTQRLKARAFQRPTGSSAHIHAQTLRKSSYSTRAALASPRRSENPATFSTRTLLSSPMVSTSPSLTACPGDFSRVPLMRT